MATSEFEKAARKEAVEAVERRWQRKHDEECALRMRKRIRDALVSLVLLAGLAGMGVFAVRQFAEMHEIRNEIGEWKQLLGFESHQILSSDECERMDAYVELLGSFRGKPCALWQDAEAAIRPKTAAAGVRYLTLYENDVGGLRLLRMESDGAGSLRVWLLSPFQPPLEMIRKDFAEAVAGRTYFILCAGTVYVNGAADADAAGRDLDRLLEEALQTKR